MNRRDPNPPDARALFERASARLDPATAARLREARRAALAGIGRPRRSALGLPAAAFATTVLALGLAWWWPGRDAGPPAAFDPAAPSQAELEALLVEEDADFYAWLAEAPVATNGGERR
ncbi:hypothetical protein [Arenimonas fontis]|uniref:DUF3619 family protein n=1 Tax=Arenimonas fontis TaxID=2608255 RepID=A0A5B2Z7L3_9GAMM|nr:hypothetical protein [Arenimonas fontis]KAA2284176.1 hypothetical protein F0415_10535 [Arenimonas fontis]